MASEVLRFGSMGGGLSSDAAMKAYLKQHNLEADLGARIREAMSMGHGDPLLFLAESIMRDREVTAKAAPVDDVFHLIDEFSRASETMTASEAVPLSVRVAEVEAVQLASAKVRAKRVALQQQLEQVREREQFLMDMTAAHRELFESARSQLAIELEACERDLEHDRTLYFERRLSTIEHFTPSLVRSVDVHNSVFAGVCA